MKQIFIILFVIFALGLMALEVEPHGAQLVFKIKPAYRGMMQKSAERTGIASLDSSLNQLKARSLQHFFHFSPTRSQNHELAYIYTFETDLPKQAALNLLKRDPAVEYAELVYPDELLASPNDAYYSGSEYFAALNAEAAWDIHIGENGSSPVIMALVDTGLRWNHPDIAQNIWQNLGEDANGNGYTIYYNGSTWVYDPGDLNGVDDDGNGFVDDLIGWDFMLDALGNQNYDPYESDGHGTRVAGIMNSRTNNSIGTSSLAWNLTLMPISCSIPGSGSIYRGYEGIIYAAENGAHIINCSWGGTNYSQAYQDVINYAHGLGSVIIAAAGNSNNSIPIYPAAYKNVLAVAALQNTGVKSSVSNYGAYVDLGAPNTNVGTLASGSYTYVSGATSYASPIASSLAGLIKSYMPAISQADLIKRIKGSCDDVDALNAGKENLLGEGKLNAFRALSEINPMPDSEVRLGLIENRGATDANLNRAVEPGETFSINLLLRSYGDYPANGTFVLSSSNPAVTILSNTHNQAIPADDYIVLTSAFSIQASPSATSQYVTFTLTTLADLPVVAGGTLSFSILIHAGGIFVWEGVANARNMSGAFIRDTLQDLGKQVVYGTTFPSSFYSFDAVFLSFGAVDSNITRFDSPTMYYALKEYLMDSGRVYVEGADAVGFDMGYFFPAFDAGQDGNDVLWPLLGIADATDGSTHTISNLNGMSETPAAGMLFSASNQTNNDYMDTFTPIPAYAKSAFEETGYGCVAVSNLGGYGQRSVVFSYALRELVDSAFPSTRANLIARIIDFFEAPDPTLPVELSSFTATYANGAQLAWQTASETNLSGYYIFRNSEPDLSKAIQLNLQIIPAQGGSQGARYTYSDTELPQEQQTLYYWLQALSYDGFQQHYGPLSLNIPSQGDPEMPPAPNPQMLSLAAFPNPFTHQLSMQLLNPAKQKLKIQIYNIRGQLMSQYPLQNYDAGTHNLVWDGKDASGRPAAPGIYLLEVSSPNQLIRHKVIKF